MKIQIYLLKSSKNTDPTSLTLHILGHHDKMHTMKNNFQNISQLQEHRL